MTARLWGAASGATIRTFTGHTNLVQCVAFSPDGTQILTGSRDGTARLWNANTGVPLRTFSGMAWVRSVQFASDGATILTGSNDTTARIWDAHTGAPIRTFLHPDRVRSAVFSPDGSMVLTGCQDMLARLWNSTAGTIVRTFSGHTGEVWSVAFSPDGTRALSGGDDKTARLWRAGFGLSVASNPVEGVSVQGDVAGITPFSAVNYQTDSMALTAPQVASVAGLDYGFIRWVIDGQDQPQGQSLVSITMDADRSALAVSCPRSMVQLLAGCWNASRHYGRQERRPAWVDEIEVGGGFPSAATRDQPNPALTPA